MYREFTPHDAQMTQYALAAYAVGLPAMIMPRILASGFYAQKNVKTPTKIAVISLSCTQIFNLLLVWHLQHVGLSLAIALGAWVNALLLFTMLRLHELYTPKAGWRGFLLRVLAATAAMAAVLWLAQSLLAADWTAMRGMRRAMLLLGLVALGAAAYFTTLRAMGMRIREFRRKEG